MTPQDIFILTVLFITLLFSQAALACSIVALYRTKAEKVTNWEAVPEIKEQEELEKEVKERLAKVDKARSFKEVKAEIKELMRQ